MASRAPKYENERAAARSRGGDVLTKMDAQGASAWRRRAAPYIDDCRRRYATPDDAFEDGGAGQAPGETDEEFAQRRLRIFANDENNAWQCASRRADAYEKNKRRRLALSLALALALVLVIIGLVTYMAAGRLRRSSRMMPRS